MKIAIDGFNLGFSQGTGFATYARELANLLMANGYSVSVCYGLNGVSNNPDVSWQQFINKLASDGESSRHDVSQWAWYCARYLPKQLMRQSLIANPLQKSENIDVSHLKDKLPATAFLNLPSVFRVAQCYALIRNYPLAIAFPKGQQVDIFHATCPLPLYMKNVPNVVTIHDLIPLMLTNSTDVNLHHYRRILKLSMQKADRIFTVSEHSRHDLINYFQLPEEKVIVTYQTVNIPERYRQLDEEAVSLMLEQNYGLKKNGYFLFFGSVEPKKNIARIIAAMQLAKTDYPLVIVGKNGWLYDDVQQLLAGLHEQAAGRQKFRRIYYLPFEQLMYLLKGACALVFPSLYEGFGLPVLEAMMMGCPVITANVSSLPEVAGDAAILVNPLDVGEIADAIDRLAGDAALREDLIKRGLKQVEKFSAAQHMQRLARGYQLAMGAS